MALTPENKCKLKEQLDKRRNEEGYVREIEEIEKKAQDAPFYRYCFNQQRELDTLQKAHDKKTGEAMTAAQALRAEDFAFEMNKMKNEEFREKKIRQQLRQDCPELRDLERKLNAAYANKIVLAQIKEKEARRIKEQMIEQEQAAILAKAHIPEREYFRQEKEKEIRQQEKYKRALQDQMIFQENKKRTRYEEFLIEKKLIDELVQRIQAEQEREIQKKYCDMLKTQEDIRGFKESQQVWRVRAKEKLEKEDLAIEEFIRKKIEDSKKSAEAKAARDAFKEQMSEEMAKKVYMETRKQQEKDEIISELLEAEKRELFEREHREKQSKQERMRVEIHHALNKQIEQRLDDMKREADRDARYKEELIAQMAENEKLEQMSQAKRRVRMMQLRRDIEDTIKANRLKKAMDVQVKLKQYELAKEEAEKRRKLIEEERVRMIREHAVNLLGYMPAGIMTESEINQLGEELKTRLICTEKQVN